MNAPVRLTFAAILLGTFLVVQSAAFCTAGESTQVISVSRTFNGSPFSYRMKLLSESDAYRVYRLTYPAPVVTPVEQNNTIPADYYLPKSIKPGAPKRPAVICLHILAGNYELVHMTCSLLASRGIPAVMFKLPYYGERSLPGGPRALLEAPRLLLDTMPQGVQDVRRTVDLLASRPEVDPKRIGITGISLGGIVAATAAESEPRLSRAVLILAGGDLPTIIHHARETRELSKLIKSLTPAQQAELARTIAAVDPLGNADKLRARARAGKVLMINAAEDHVIPKPCTEKLAAALGISDKVVWLEGLGHYTAMAALARVMETTARFFEQDMPEGAAVKPPTSAGRSPMQTVIGLVRQLAALATSPPEDGRCHFVDLDLSVVLGDGETFKSRLRYIRGSHHKFRLEARVPQIGEVALGQCGYPWMTSVKDTVFLGVKNHDGQPSDHLATVDPNHLLKLRMAAGVLGAAALTPSVLDRLIGVSDDTAADGTPAVRIAARDRKIKGTVRLVLQADGETLRRATFDFKDARGSVEFRVWRINTVANDALFEPPAGRSRKEVEASHLYRIFGAMFNFAMEHVQ